MRKIPKARSQTKNKRRVHKKMNQSIPKSCFSNVSIGDYNVKLRDPESMSLVQPWNKAPAKILKSVHGKRQFKKTIFDTWNPNQFKIKPANVVIPLNPKFPIKKITFDCDAAEPNPAIQSWLEESKENLGFVRNVGEKTPLEKLSIEKLRQSKNQSTLQGFHQMFVSMAAEFSPSWREQIQKITK